MQLWASTYTRRVAINTITLADSCIHVTNAYLPPGEKTSASSFNNCMFVDKRGLLQGDFKATHSLRGSQTSSERADDFAEAIEDANMVKWLTK
jgi:hypothetical protein